MRPSCACSTTASRVALDLLPRVFDLFAQVSGRARLSEGGLGIGFALVRKLVELHGGRVEAYSSGLDGGNEFIVRLPLEEQASVEEAATAEKEAVMQTSASLRALVIDDDFDVGGSLAMLLESFDAVVRVVDTGTAGLETVSAFKPSLIFLDIGMPDIDGYETARRIRTLPEGRDATLVALTGWGQEDNEMALVRMFREVTGDRDPKPEAVLLKSIEDTFKAKRRLE